MFALFGSTFALVAIWLLARFFLKRLEKGALDSQRVIDLERARGKYEKERTIKKVVDNADIGSVLDLNDKLRDRDK